MRISLLRAPTSPDAETDQGRHSFCFALLPHRGTFDESNVVAEGIRFNNPLRVRVRPRSIQPESTDRVFTIDGDKNVVMETIKRGDDDGFCRGGEKSVILRIYEAYGGAGSAKIST